MPTFGAVGSLQISDSFCQGFVKQLEKKYDDAVQAQDRQVDVINQSISQQTTQSIDNIPIPFIIVAVILFIFFQDHCYYLLLFLRCLQYIIVIDELIVIIVII